MTLVDTHAHIHFKQFAGEVDKILQRAAEAGITRVISVGVNTDDSRQATELAAKYEGVWGAVGIHPYDAEEVQQGINYIKELATRRKVVAIGECGLDFYKATARLDQQEAALRAQIELALELDLPLIFHVREAFGSFFAIVNDYAGIRGVVHSFTGQRREMEEAVAAGLHIALNGIMTFTKDEHQLEAVRQVPAERLLLETDCPFLSPAPDRSARNEPAKVADIAQFVADLRGESPEQLGTQTTVNAERLFSLKG